MGSKEFFHETDTKTEREHLIELFGNLIKKMDEEHLPDMNIYGLNPKSVQCIYDSLKLADFIKFSLDDLEKVYQLGWAENCGEDIKPEIRDLHTFPPIEGNLIDRESLLNKWDAMSPRGRTEFDQVIMTEPTVFKVDKVIDRLKCIPFDYRKINNDESPYADGLEEGAYKSIERAIDVIEKGGLNEY